MREEAQQRSWSRRHLIRGWSKVSPLRPVVPWACLPLVQVFCGRPAAPGTAAAAAAGGVGGAAAAVARGSGRAVGWCRRRGVVDPCWCCPWALPLLLLHLPPPLRQDAAAAAGPGAAAARHVRCWLLGLPILKAWRCCGGGGGARYGSLFSLAIRCASLRVN